jgi:sec-independent protein translocase protein TatB
MFDIGWGELVVIGIVALIAIGPKELPTVLRTLGQWTGKMRRMANEFQGQFQEALREAEVADLKKQFDEAASAAQNITNPLETARKEIEGALEDKPAAEPVTTPTAEPVSAPAEGKESGAA